MDKLVANIAANPLLVKGMIAVAGLIVIAIVVRVLRGTVTGYIHDPDTRYRARKFVTFVGYMAGILLLTVVFSDRLGGLTVAFGVAGAGIAFALQEVIASIAGWLAVSVGGFFNIGDRVQLGGIKGDVIDISILRTTIMECGEWVKGDAYTGRIVRVANSFVFKEPVYNYSGDFPFLWDEIVVPVKHGCDHREAREILSRAANQVVGDYTRKAASVWQQMVRKYRIEDARVEPMVMLVANDNWLEFTVRYIVDYRARRLTRDQLFSRIVDEFNATEGRIAFASTTFHIVEAPALDIKLHQERPGRDAGHAPPPLDA